MNIIEEIKIFINYVKHFRIEHIFLTMSLFLGVLIFFILFSFKVSLLYLLIYLFWVLLTFIYIKTAREIYYATDIKTWDIVKFFIRYMSIILFYIFLFAIAYYLVFLLNDGYFLSNGTVHILNLSESFFISSITFFSYEVGLSPIGFIMRFFMVMQLFISQIFLIGVLFVMLSHLIEH